MQQRTCMVSYQAWVSIVFETLQDRGAEFDNIADGATVMQFAGETWTMHGDRLQRYSQEQAKDAAIRLVRDR